MNYWRDTANGQVYFACVILTNSENPKEPPKVIGLGPLLAEERFIPVDSPETDVVSITVPASSSMQITALDDRLPKLRVVDCIADLAIPQPTVRECITD